MTLGAAGVAGVVAERQHCDGGSSCGNAKGGKQNDSSVVKL